MIVGLDTSVVVRVLCGEPENLALEAGRFLLDRQRAEDKVLVSDLVLAETYYALQHHYRVPKKAALAALHTFLATPFVKGTGEAASILKAPDLESANPGFLDQVIHSHYLRNGADEMVTFEKAAAKLPKVRVLPIQDVP